VGEKSGITAGPFKLELMGNNKSDSTSKGYQLALIAEVDS